MIDTLQNKITPELNRLFEKALYIPYEQENAKKIYYFKINRALVRRDKLRYFFRIKKFFRKKFKNITVIPLYALRDAPEVHIFYLYDADFVKLTCFDIEKMEKRVLWDSKKRMLKEDFCAGYFRKTGFPVPDIFSTDRLTYELVQEIVGEPFVRFNDIHQLDLIAYSLLNAQDKSVFGTPYIESARYLNYSNILPDRIVEQCRSIIMESLVGPVERNNARIPRLLVHGDIHRGSIIISQNGDRYIIDFDKVIIGSAYYDFVFLKIRYTEYTIDDLSYRIGEINRHYGINRAFPELDALKLAISTFIFDACRYINKNRSVESEVTIKKNSFTVKLIDNALSLYQKLG